MTRRIIRWVLMTALAALVLGTSGLAVLLHTDAGARIAWSVAVKGSGRALSAASLTGRLSGGLTLEGIEWTDPGLHVRVSKLRLDATVGWFPFRVIVRDATLNRVDLAWAAPSKPADTDFETPAPPVPIVINRARADAIVLHEIGQMPVIEPLSAELAGRWGPDLSLSHARLHSSDMTVIVKGSAQFEAPHQHELESRLQLPAEWTEWLGLSSPWVSAQVTGDVRSSRISLEDEPGQLAAEIELKDWLDQPRWTLELNGRGLSPMADEYGDRLAIDQIRISAEGGPDQFDLSGDGRLLVDQEPLNLIAAGHGDRSGLILESLSLAAGALDLHMAGNLNWLTPAAVFEADIRRLDPGTWVEEWPAAYPLHGAVHLDWTPDRLTLKDASLRVDGTEATLTGAATWAFGSRQLQADVQWQAWQWPWGAEPMVTSPSGQLKLGGHVTDWHFDGQLGVQVPDYPPASLSLTGSGNARAAELTLQRGEILGGTVLGEASLDWQGAVSWRSALSGQGIDLAPLWPDWPATLDVEIEVAQQAPGQGVSVKLQRLQGNLRGEPIDGAGSAMLSGRDTRFDSFQLRAPGSRLELNGDLANGLQFSVQAVRPGLLSRLAGAEVSGSGLLSLTSGQPDMDIELLIQDLNQGPLHIDRLSLSGSAGPNNPDAALDISATSIAWQGLHMEQAVATLANSAGQQVLDVGGRAGAYDLKAQTRGRLMSGRTAADWRWSGALTELSVERDNQSLITLHSPAELELSPSRLALEPACIRLPQEGEACIDAGWAAGGQAEARLDLNSLPMQLLADLMHSGLRVTQRLDGTMAWRQGAGIAPSGSAQLELSGGVIESLEADQERVQTSPGVFGFQLTDGQLSQGRLRLPFNELGQVNLDFSIADLALDGSGRLAGRAYADINSLSLLALFVPGLEATAGSLDIDVALSGRTADPHLEGSIKLHDALLNLPGLGLSDVYLGLRGNVSRNDQLILKGSLRSGEGQAEIVTRLDIRQWNNPVLDLQLKGEELMLFNLPNLQAVAQPDLRLGWQNGRWLLGGQLDIPRARLAPSGAVTSRVSESDDVEIVAGEVPARSTTVGQQALPISGAMQLVLGDQVHIDMPGVNLAVTGQVELAWDNSALPTAMGQLLVNGDVRTYGPRLRVEQGRVRFPGQALDNAILDIRAERDIFGNTQIRAAGVRIDGTARRPRLQAYTQPLTTEERAWTLLVTGSDFEYGQGIGAFDIGTYISPRLYISYGISLFDDERQVGARYDLRKGFGIKATSSENGNGLDMSYTVER